MDGIPWRNSKNFMEIPWLIKENYQKCLKYDCYSQQYGIPKRKSSNLNAKKMCKWPQYISKMILPFIPISESSYKTKDSLNFSWNEALLLQIL